MPLEYYDKLLLGMVASLTVGAAVGVVTSVPFLSGLAGGALVATLFIYDAVFRNPPLPVSTTQARAAAVVWHVFLVWTLIAAFG